MFFFSSYSSKKLSNSFFFKSSTSSLCCWMIWFSLGKFDLKICSKTEVETVGSRFQSKIKDRLGRIHPQYTHSFHLLFCCVNRKKGELHIRTLTLFLTIWYKGLKKSTSMFNLMCTATQQQGTYFVKVFYNYEFTVQ